MFKKSSRISSIYDYFRTGANSIAGGVLNFFTQRQLSTKAVDLGLTSDSIARLTKFNALMTDGATRTQAFKQTMLGASRATKETARYKQWHYTALKQALYTTRTAMNWYSSYHVK